VPKALHPTKTKLIDTAIQFLKQMPIEEVSVEIILKESNISKGSMYHHFEDLGELLDTAIIEQFAKWVDESIKVLSEVLTAATSRQEMYDGLVQVTDITQAASLHPVRLQRVQAIAKAHGNPKMSHLLQVEQDRLTEAISDIIIDSQDKSLLKKDVDPKALAVFIQAYTLGKIIDDISGEPCNQEGWNSILHELIKLLVHSD
jgi:AcrR family transcriptional regulator